jgi:hypothetical protein
MANGGGLAQSVSTTWDFSLLAAISEPITERCRVGYFLREWVKRD